MRAPRVLRDSLLCQCSWTLDPRTLELNTRDFYSLKQDTILDSFPVCICFSLCVIL